MNTTLNAERGTGSAEQAQRLTMNGKPVYTVPSKTVINFDSRFDKKLLCDGLTFTTGQACVYKCAFCYVPAMQVKAMDRFEEQGVIYPASQTENGARDRLAQHFGVVIRNQDPIEVARKQLLSKPEAFRRQKLVIYASPKVDVAGNMELVRETVEMCKLILELTNWDVRLLSKSNLLPKVAELLEKTDGCGECAGCRSRKRDSKERIIYGVSTGTLDDNLAAAFEEGTPKVSKRIESLHWLQDHGYRTFGMICPSLPLAKDEDYQPWALRMHEAIRSDRCEHVWAEVINLRGNSFVKTVAALVKAGFTQEAELLRTVSTDKAAWENYARQTFLAHSMVTAWRLPGTLRFLQYATKDSHEWWLAQRERGAVIL